MHLCQSLPAPSASAEEESYISHLNNRKNKEKKQYVVWWLNKNNPKCISMKSSIALAVLKLMKFIKVLTWKRRSVSFVGIFMIILLFLFYTSCCVSVTLVILSPEKLRTDFYLLLMNGLTMR